MGDKYEVKDDGSIVVANLAADPANPDSGQFYFNSGSKLLRVFNGTIWQTIDTDQQTLQQVTGQGNETTDNIILKTTAILDFSQQTGDATIKIKATQALKINDETNDISLLSDGLLDMSGMTTPSEIKLRMYAQDSQPTLDADGKMALWNKTDTNQLFLLARNNATTKRVEIS